MLRIILSSYRISLFRSTENLSKYEIRYQYKPTSHNDMNIYRRKTPHFLKAVEIKS